MMLPGELEKEEGLYHAYLDVLDAYGQGKTRRAACDMLERCVLDIAEGYRPLQGFKVAVTESGEMVQLSSNDPARLIATVLRYQRELHAMSLADVAQRLGGTSRSAYAQYEHGKREPSIGKLQELLTAVAPELALSIIPRTARVLSRGDEDLDLEAIDAVLREPSPANVRALEQKRSKPTKRATHKPS